LRFDELVQRTQTEGPQRVSIRGRESVVIVAADEFEQLKPRLTGQALIDVLRASPHRDLVLFPSQQFQSAVDFPESGLLAGVKGI
jgi:prevent-host-death family protein